jgi:IS1 family transposase
MARFISHEKRVAILRLLVEGNSVRSTSRLIGTNIKTVLRQLVVAGEHCRQVMDRTFRNLTLDHIECDEIWTFVQKKQGRLSMEERDRNDVGDIYLFLALDQTTKLIPSFLLGKRSADNGRRFMVDLASRLRWPTPHASDSHHYGAEGYQPITQISTDAWAGYREATDLAFARHARYGQIVKYYRNTEMPGRYAAPEMIQAERRPIRGIEELRSICTSHVERTNLTVRTFLKRFTRLALGFSKKLPNLEAAVSLHVAYYNFCWRPATLRVSPAMAAKVTDRLWRMDDLMLGCPA